MEMIDKLTQHALHLLYISSSSQALPMLGKASTEWGRHTVKGRAGVLLFAVYTAHSTRNRAAA